MAIGSSHSINDSIQRVLTPPYLWSFASEAPCIAGAAGAFVCRNLRIGTERARHVDVVAADVRCDDLLRRIPASRQRSTTAMLLNWSVPTPPWQWFILGTI